MAIELEEKLNVVKGKDFRPIEFDGKYNAIALKFLLCRYTFGWDKKKAEIPAGSRCFVQNNVPYKSYHDQLMSTED